MREKREGEGGINSLLLNDLFLNLKRKRTSVFTQRFERVSKWSARKKIHGAEREQLRVLNVNRLSCLLDVVGPRNKRRPAHRHLRATARMMAVELHLAATPTTLSRLPLLLE